MIKSYKTTFVIPTYNRSKEFIKAYSYFVTQKDADKIRIIVVDGSNNECDLISNRDFCQKNGFDYIHFIPEREDQNSFYNKALLGIERVKTETTKICDDEDIISAGAVIECAEFLEKNEEYTTIAGNYKSTTISEHRISTTDCYCGEGIEQDDPLARLWSLLYFYNISNCHHVFKTKSLLNIMDKTVKMVPESTKLLLSERIMCSIAILLGKEKRLDIDYCVRINNTKNKSKYNTLTSQFYGPMKAMKFINLMPGRKVNHSFTPTDAVDFMRDIFKDYIEPYGDIQHDILTIILSSHIASNTLSSREMRYFKDYVEEKGFDLSLYNFIDEIHQRPNQIYYNYVPNAHFKGTIAIYGAGTLGKFIYNKIKNNDSLTTDCFIDKNYKTTKSYMGHKVISPDESSNLNIDYIIIANDVAGDEIYKSLLDYGVDKSKILTIEEFTKGSPIFTYKDYWEKSFE